MTKDDAINILLDHLSAGLIRTLEDAIAKEEREECAKICEKLVLEDDSFYGEFSGGKDCAKSIRERGKDA